MIEPSKIQAAADKLMDENIRFRSFLLERADYDELDEQFKEMHDELFAAYDCSACANCCRSYFVALKDVELTAIAAFLGLSRQGLIQTYLSHAGEEHGIKPPCCFLDKEGRCLIQECKPETCRDYPYTDKRGRLGNLWKVLSTTEQCPIAFEILERLKVVYGFE